MKQKTTIFSLGYQGLNIADYVDTLKNNGVGLVIDVRETAWSYKIGFSASPLRLALEKEGIEYLHLKSAGNPSKYRKSAKTTKQCLSWYRRYLGGNQECLGDIALQIKKITATGKHVCLTCYERNADDCHRSILTDFLQNMKPKLNVVHLQA